MKTKEVLIAERLMSKPAGVGLRNFWAGAIHRTMKEIRDSRYMVWRKKYAAEK